MSRKKTTKIEKHDLGPRIFRMITHDGLNTTQVAAALTDQGFAISQPTISRWWKDQRENPTIQNEVQELIQEHIKKEIPKDMDALESMEGQCLEWAEEGVADQAERIMVWERVVMALDTWAEQIKAAALQGEKEKKALAKRLVGQCLKWIIEDRGNQRERLAAMRMAANIVEIKLRFSGVIDGAASGNIYIGQQGEANDPQPPDDKGQGEERKLFVVRGNPDA